MKLLTKDKSFYTKLLALAVPMALQNLVNVSVSLADAIMGGFLGETALTAANFANKFGTIYMLILFGLGSGANVLIAQYWGKNNNAAIKQVMTIMYRVLAITATIFTFIAIVFPSWAIAFFTKDMAVIKLGAEYLRIIGFSYIISGFVTTTLTVHRAVGVVRPAMVIYTISLVVNFAVDCTLIFGLFGAPKLGIVGAAIGTLVGRVLELFLTAFYLKKFENKIYYTPRDFFHSSKAYATSYAKVATPVLINEICWGAGATAIAMIVGHINTSFAAAESVVSVLNQLMTVFIWGIAHAAGTVIGNTIGEGKEEKAKEYGRTAAVLSVALGFIACGAILLIRDPFVSVFRITELGKDYARQMINVHSLIIIAQSVSAVCLIGVLRAAGNAKFVLIVDIVFLWAVSIPLGYLLGIKLGMSVAVVYAALKIDEVLKMIVSIFKIGSGKWVHDMTDHSSESVETSIIE